MLKIVTNTETITDYSKITYIRLADNGCYVICDAADAEGICAKLPKQVEVVDEETQEITYVSTYEDKVFRFEGAALKGTEEICSLVEAE